MSSFFTTPASQRKRKRDEVTSVSVKRRNTNFRAVDRDQRIKSSRTKRDESISGSGSDDDDRRIPSDEEPETGSDSEIANETGAERRLRLAEKYLENIKGEVDEVGFDAEEIDRDLIAERLQEDVVC